MDKLRVLIADGSEEFRKALSDALYSHYQVRTARDGFDTMAQLQGFTPDVLVLDLMLPGLDGISLLQRAAEEGLRPMVLATTRFYNDYIIAALEQLEVGYIMVKPCDIQAVVQRMADLSGHLKPSAFTRPDMRTVVSNLLLSLNVPTKLRGYGYLREAVLLQMDDPGRMVTKEIYPMVAQQYGSSSVQVERSVRSAINTAWERRDEQIWRLYFQPEGGSGLKRPSNGAFIARLADHILLEMEDSEGFMTGNAG